MERKKSGLLRYTAFGSKAPTDPRWWLGNGAVPESTAYTVYDALAATTELGARVNLANPGVRDATTTGNAPSWAANSGWSFLTANTNWLTMNTPWTSTSTMLIWLEDSAQGTTFAFGNPSMYVAPFIAGTGCRIYTTGNITVNQCVGGILGIRNGQGLYFNGKKYTTIGAHPGGSTNIFLGAQNNGAGVPALPWTGRILRVAHYNFQLSDAQMEAVWNSMRAYELPAVDSYSSKVLALNPIAYYPCNQKYGGWMLDQINGANQVINVRFMYPGQPGLNGLSIQGGNGTVAGLNMHFISFQNEFQLLTGFTPDEFSMSYNLRNINSDTQGRMAQIWMDNGDYIAPEMRSGLFSIYHKEGAAVWNTLPSVALPNDTWIRMVVYNSKAAGKSGFYINGVKYEYNKVGTGFTSTTLGSAGYPVIGQQMSGFFNHVAFYNRPLNQTEVDSLL